jgi:hypothetical protein
MSFADGVGVTMISGGVDSVAVTWCVSLRFVSRSVLKVVARCMSQLGGVAVVMKGIARAEAQMAQSWTIARAMRMYIVFVVVVFEDAVEFVLRILRVLGTFGIGRATVCLEMRCASMERNC